MTEPFTVGSAARAREEGRLADWVEAFLRSPGSDNELLAAALGFEGKCWAGPLRLRLDQLRPLAGPDEDEVVVPVDEAEWEDDVDEMGERLDEGWDPPPLVVSCRPDGLYLEDGNHRHESMRRAGRSHGWAIVAFDSAQDRDDFLTRLDS